MNNGHKLALPFAYLLNLFDLVMTYRLYHLYGLSIEANPIGRFLLETNLAIPFKVVIVGAALLALHFSIKKYPKWKWAKWLILAVYAVLAVYHLFLCFYIPRA